MGSKAGSTWRPPFAIRFNETAFADEKLEVAPKDGVSVGEAHRREEGLLVESELGGCA